MRSRLKGGRACAAADCVNGRSGSRTLYALCFRFFKDHDLNGDGSINGHEVVGFMDKLSDLLAEN